MLHQSDFTSLPCFLAYPKKMKAAIDQIVTEHFWDLGLTESIPFLVKESLEPFFPFLRVDG